jgi:hypothetical protein
MKKLMILLLAAVTLAGCNNDPRLKMQPTGTFGTAFTTDSVLTVEQVVSLLNTGDNFPVKVKGTITQYCKSEGCWITLKNTDGEDLFIEVKDKAFVLPHNIEQKTAIANGIATKDTAEGKLQLSIVADGIVIE